MVKQPPPPTSRETENIIYFSQTNAHMLVKNNSSRGDKTIKSGEIFSFHLHAHAHARMQIENPFGRKFEYFRLDQYVIGLYYIQNLLNNELDG